MSKARPTHFLCIPLINEHSRPQLEISLARLKAAGSPRIREKAFRPIGSLHLTLGTMNLSDESALAQAIDYLRGPEIAEAIHEVKDSAMGSPSKASVVYIYPFDSTNRLLPLCNRFHDLFSKAVFVIPENRPLRLHATVINTRYTSKSEFPPKVDVTKLISRFENEVWAENVRLGRLAICKMGAEKVMYGSGKVVDEVYKEVATVSLV